MEETEESYEDCFLSRLIFGQALDALLEPGTGVFIELRGAALDIGVKRVIVHNNITTNEIGVLRADERTDLKNGDRVTLINENIIEN